MNRSRRNRLLLLLGGGSLLASGACVLIYSVPTFKAEAKERWHRWSCPSVPEARSQRVIPPDGAIGYSDPVAFMLGNTGNSPNIRAEFEDRTSTFFAMSYDGRGILLLDGSSAAITRRVSDVADSLTAIGVSLTMRSADNDPDVRIIIRIDDADGNLVDWQQKRLKASEHKQGIWEVFNFEWLLRDRSVAAEERISVFLASDGPVEVDAMAVVFRSAEPLRRAS
jgi:hypothetical protein